jgi:hypothetical protein
MVAAYPPAAPPALHTGDARLTREATRACPVIGRLRGRAVLVLDTTYADPQYCFPSQRDVVDGVVRAVQVGAGWGPGWGLGWDRGAKGVGMEADGPVCLCLHLRLVLGV